MKLEGSCHCGAVRFSLESETPYPFMLCYCSICRKIGGGGGYAINIMGLAATLKVQGANNVKSFHPWSDHPDRTERSEGKRHFCGECGTALWVSNERWSELIHPFASAIDTPLPSAPERNHILLDFKPAWVPLPDSGDDHHYPQYPGESIQSWHEQRGLLAKGG